MNQYEYSSTNPMRHTREFVVRSLYQWQIDQDSIPALMVNSEDQKLADLCRQYIKGSVGLYDVVVSSVTPLLADAQWERLYLTERAILMQAYYELSQCFDVPYRVIINEAVELAKIYGGDESFRLINKLVDKLALLLRPMEVANFRNNKSKHG